MRRRWSGETSAIFIIVALLAWGCGSQEAPEPVPEAAAEDPLQADGELLEAIGYVQWSGDLDDRSNKHLSGVVRHDPNRSQPGLNLYASASGHAYLLDDSGEIVHQWTGEIRESARLTYIDESGSYHPPPIFRRLEWKVGLLLPGGDLLMIALREALVRLDWDSNVIWRCEIEAHHDLAIGPDGNIYVLTIDDPIVTKTGPGIFPERGQAVTVVSPGGEVLRIIRFNTLFPEAGPEATAEAISAYVDSHPARLKKSNRGTVLDTLHANGVTILPRTVPGLGHSGDILLSLRRTDTLALLDPTGERVEWRWGPGKILSQHHPNLLTNNCLMIFDNGDGDRPWSRIVEYCPEKDQIVWEYRGTEQEPFFSESRGSVQLLENNNVLVTDSGSGRVIEVTRAGEVVWEWFEPRTRKRNGKVNRQTIYRMTRISGDLLDSLPL